MAAVQRGFRRPAMPQGLEARSERRCYGFDQHGISRHPIHNKPEKLIPAFGKHWQTIVGMPSTIRTGEEATLIQAEYEVKAVIDWWLSQAATLQPDHS
jgi:hypothetical protein